MKNQLIEKYFNSMNKKKKALTKLAYLHNNDTFRIMNMFNALSYRDLKKCL